MFLWIGTITASVVFVATLIIFISWLRSNYIRAGLRLMVLRRAKYRRLGMVALSTCLLVLGAYLTSQNTVNNPNFLYPLVGGFIGGYSGFLWLQFLCPTEFREGGIIILGNLVEWSQIQHYEWHSKYLLIEYKYWLGHQKKKIRLSPVQRIEVEKILKEKQIIV